MPYDIRLVKLASSEMVVGKYDSEKDALTDPAILQTIPSEQGVQILLLPYGYPFDQKFDGEIAYRHVMFRYQNLPQDIRDRYLEATSSITLSTGNLGLDLKSDNPASFADISSLLKK
ncbi:MAG: hypothetical protein IJD04_08860 [Desulfovibrionaceae bacterium]|nr:hypothetical protein [Desulfovibrionaceae bacterium]